MNARATYILVGFGFLVGWITGGGLTDAAPSTNPSGDAVRYLPLGDPATDGMIDSKTAVVYQLRDGRWQPVSTIAPELDFESFELLRRELLE